MSRYPVKYVSGSKKAALNIEDMNTSHLMNAWRKLLVHLVDISEDGETDQATAETIGAINEELRSRGCTFDQETQRWIVPPKEPEPGHEYIVGVDPAEEAP